MRLKDKVAFITGAGGGIGRAAALHFAREGARIAGLDRDGDRVQKVVRELPQEGKHAAFETDVGSSQSVNDAVRQAIKKFGRVDILFNNAAITSLSSVASIGDDELERVLTVNVKSMFYVSRAVLPQMVAQKSGAILNSSSITGLVGAPGMAAYAASKGAIITFTRSLALEQAENGIRVNCICPASIDTPMLQKSFDQTSDPAAARERNIRRHPLGRLGTPEDVAGLALFLVSNEASFITGSTYVIDGGASIARRWLD
jgi:NAD(P)-dependent dehydrogenase (short-subunit alcohol dehydrogenase family)